MLVANSIIYELGRGISYLKGQGVFWLVNTLVKNFEITGIKVVVKEVDDSAFIYITERIEVTGKDFTWK